MARQNIPDAGDWINSLEGIMREQVVEAADRFLALSVMQLNWRHQPDKWSIAELLQHLNAAADLYTPRLNKAVTRARPVKSAQRAHRNGRMGQLFIRGLRSKKTFKSPKDFEPDLSNIADPHAVVRDFRQKQLAIAELMAKSQQLDLQRTRLSSPSNFLLRFNLGDAFAIHTYHVKRHLEQAQERIQMSGFPPA
ncbi:MAG: DinB family protein [Bacteroidetes bacterium]|jgi:hypothetical protein|nr:DinB family protein [Bacteroidota bacterium]